MNDHLYYFCIALAECLKYEIVFLPSSKFLEKASYLFEGGSEPVTHYNLKFPYLMQWPVQNLM
jgi:hypothetical protein